MDTLELADITKLGELREKHNLACLSVTAGDIIALPAGSLVMTAIEKNREHQSGKKKEGSQPAEEKQLVVIRWGAFLTDRLREKKSSRGPS